METSRVATGSTGTAPPAARSLPTAALFRDETGQQELQIAVNAETGQMTATLSGPTMEAFGEVPVVLLQLSPSSTTLSSTVFLHGYDIDADRFHQLEVSISMAWTIDRTEPTGLEVAGTALVTDIDDQTLQRFQAVRCHPYNHLSHTVVTVDASQSAVTASVPESSPEASDAPATARCAQASEPPSYLLAPA